MGIQTNQPKNKPILLAGLEDMDVSSLDTLIPM